MVIIFIKDFLDQDFLNDENVYLLGKQVSNILFERYIALNGSFIKK